LLFDGIVPEFFKRINLAHLHIGLVKNSVLHRWS
jgi:hypothetical protein